MHPNPAFHWVDQAAMLDLVAATAFTRLFAVMPGGLRVVHVPVVVAPGPALRFHLANSNWMAAALDGSRALALTEGPDAYVSANWSADVRGTVPTWNYVAVECEGQVQRLNRSALIDLLDTLSVQREATVGENWTRAKMEPARFEAMLGAITAYELRIDDLRGTRKLSQNQPAAERARIMAGIDRTAPAMAVVMRG